MAFDKESVYDEQIAPLMTKINAICKEHKIPMAATFQYNTDSRCTTILPQDFACAEMHQIIIGMQPRRSLGCIETRITDEAGTTRIDLRKL